MEILPQYAVRLDMERIIPFLSYNL